MKKSLICALAVAMLCAPALTVSNASAATASVPAARTETGLVADFSDDFESYETGKWIEETTGFDLNWSNNVLDGGEPLGMDSHLYERAKIVYENGTDGNKVLHLDNRVGGDSFFYITPKGDRRYKNFKLSFKVKWLNGGSWISAVVRKDQNVWYSGCNNLNMTVFPAVDDSCLQPLPYRNMPGSPDNQLKSSATLEDNGYTMSEAVYTDSQGSYLNRWFTIGYEINEKSYKMYVNDTLVVDLTYPAKKLLDFGYVSIGGSGANVYFDDFQLENLDTEAPPALEEEEPETPSETPSDAPATETPKEEKSGCGSSAPALAVGALIPVGFALFKKRRS